MGKRSSFSFFFSIHFDFRYTGGHRAEILAYQAAPIQMQFLGYEATLGAPFVQYIITDQVATPVASHASFFTEKFLLMPNTFFSTDFQHTHPEVFSTTNFPKRSDYNLSDDQIVFICWSQLYKFDPVTFKSWMNILKAG